MARRGADVDPDRAEDDVVGLAFFEFTRECRGIDRLVAVAVRAGQAGWKTASIRDGMPRLRSSSS